MFGRESLGLSSSPMPDRSDSKLITRECSVLLGDGVAVLTAREIGSDRKMSMRAFLLGRVCL